MGVSRVWKNKMSHEIKVIHSVLVWLPQTQTWIYNQVKNLPDKIEAHVVCEETEHLVQFVVPNIHCLHDASKLRYIYEKGLRKLQLKRYPCFLTALSNELDTHILHSHFGDVGWGDLRVITSMNLKHVVSFYGFDVNMLPMQKPVWIERYHQLFKKADIFLCEGPHMIKQLVSMGCPREKVKLQHLGIDVEKIAYCPRIWKKGEPLCVLIAASFTEKKGIPYALEALIKLQSVVPIELTIIGDARPKSHSLKEKQKILSILEVGGLKLKTKLLGYQPYTVLFEEAYKNHIFISPSVTATNGDTEGGAPISLIEMMATGMIVVSTTHCDIPEEVNYGVKDWLVAERDVDGLVGKLAWLLEHPGEWVKMLDIGRKHIETEYDAKKQGKRLANIYHEIIE